MKKISMYLDEAIDSGAAKNDSEIARKLGLSRATVSKWRSGDRSPDDDEAVKLAELLRKDPGELLAECGAARAKNPATRMAWERIAARMAGATMAGLLVFTALPQKAEAAGNQLTSCRLLFSEVTRLAGRRLSKALLRLLVLITTRPAHEQS